jgi:superfamily II RNA helicase
MYAVMKGSRPEVTSRMDFHVDFVLKTIHTASASTASASTASCVSWISAISGTYWYQDYLRQEQEIELRRYHHEQVLAQYPKTEPYWSETLKCRELEQHLKQAVNAQRKALQRELDTLKNRQLGPQWKKTAEDVQKYMVTQQALEEVHRERSELGTPLTRVEQSLAFLRAIGFVEEKEDRLTVKGILATEVNEGHPLLLTEFYLSGKGKGLSELDWVIFLSAFLESREESEESPPMSQSLHTALTFLEETAIRWEEQEATMCGQRRLNWTCTMKWMAPMKAWYEGDSSAAICQTYGEFEGNFYRSLLKLTNLVNEVISMATYCEHVEQVDQLSRVSERLRRSQWTGESLYLRL